MNVVYRSINIGNIGREGEEGQGVGTNQVQTGAEEVRIGTVMGG